jgi:hypothetical protein
MVAVVSREGEWEMWWWWEEGSGIDVSRKKVGWWSWKPHACAREVPRHILPCEYLQPLDTVWYERLLVAKGISHGE